MDNADFLERALAHMQGQKGLSSPDVQLILRNLYETAYGIHNHLEPGSPLAGVSVHPAEDCTGNSLSDVLMRKYVNARINQTFGVSWTEFLDMTHSEVESMLTIATEFNTTKNKAVNDIIDTM